MKRFFAYGIFGAFILFVGFVVVCAVTPLGYGSSGEWFRSPCDFSLRMTEIACLKTGVNPFDVWHGDVVLPPFRPNVNSKVSGPEFTEDINAYAPWEYAMMLPLSYLPRKVAWGAYFVLMMITLPFLAWVGYSVGRARLAEKHDAVIAGVLPVLLIAYPTWSNACIGNFSIIVLASVVAMALALERKRDALAGLFWAVAMVKPQIGVLFAVPLLMRRRFLTCFVAGGICLVASIIPAVMCHTSPLTLILQTPAANTFMFHGCGTWPFAFCGAFGGRFDIGIALIFGLVVCVVLTRRLPADIEWLSYLAPTAVCSMSWTYVSTYGHVMAWFFFLLLAVEMLSGPRSGKLIVIGLATVLLSTRVYNCWRGAVSAFSEHFPFLVYSDALHWHLDSLNSLADLILFSCFVLLCLSRRRPYVKD